MITPRQYERMVRLLRGAIWLYILLWVFEGVLRKWVVPGLSGPLLIVRDPVLLGIYYLAFRTRLWPSNWFVTATIWLAILSFFAGLISYPDSVTVAVFGLRAGFLHLPLIFVIPQAFDQRDARRVGMVLLALAIPMAFVMVQQFRSPADGWWNLAAGGEGSQLATAGGKVRASGFFSFVAGPMVYLPLCMAFLLETQFRSRSVPLWLAAPAAASVALAAAVSGSRGALYAVLLTIGFGLLAVILLQPKAAPRWIVGGAIGLAILGLLGQEGSVFNEGRDVMQQRMDQVTASQGENEVLVRMLDAFRAPLDLFASTPILGHGLGMGTNVGSQLLTGEVKFLLAENEWHRNIAESGPIFGILYIGLRVALVVVLGSACFTAARRGNVLPWLLYGACFLTLLNGQFGQTTIMGFAVIAGGLCVAAMREPEAEAAAETPDHGTAESTRRAEVPA